MKKKNRVIDAEQKLASEINKYYARSFVLQLCDVLLQFYNCTVHTVDREYGNENRKT